MRPSLTITDRTSGKAYNVPEELKEVWALISKMEISEEEEEVHLNYDSEYGWIVGVQYIGIDDEPFHYAEHLDLSRFTISFPNSLSKEVVREVPKKAYTEYTSMASGDIRGKAILYVASALSISLEETTNGN